MQTTLSALLENLTEEPASDRILKIAFWRARANTAQSASDGGKVIDLAERRARATTPDP